MADDTTGYNQEETPSGALPVARVPAASSPMDDLDKARSDIIAQQNRLMTMLEERNKPNPSEFFGAIARGFGDPNAKYFSQGAAGAAGNLNDLENTNRARELQTAQMRMQLAQSQLGMREQQAMTRGLVGAMNGDVGGSGGAAVPGVISQNPAAISIFSRLDPTTKALLSATAIKNPQKAIEDLVKFGLDNAKTPDEIKVLESLASGLNETARAEFLEGVRIKKSQQDLSSIIKTIAEVRQAVDSQLMTPEEGNSLINDLKRQLPKPKGSVPAVSAPQPTVTVAPTVTMNDVAGITDPAERKIVGDIVDARPAATAGTIPNKAERDLAAAGSLEVQKERIKAAADERAKVYASFNQAPADRNASSNIMALVQKSPNMFGVFEKPGLSSAIGGVVENAFNAGRFSVGMPGIRDAVAKLGANRPEDIDNMQKVAFFAVNSSLALAAAAKGAVSNFERELFTQASFSTHDTPNVLLFKADLLKARANFYSALWDDFRQFERKNPSATFTDYQDGGGKVLINKYESQLARIRDAHLK